MRCQAAGLIANDQYTACEAEATRIDHWIIADGYALTIPLCNAHHALWANDFRYAGIRPGEPIVSSGVSR